MFSIANDKSPGPDGYTSFFFKSAWSIVGMDVCAAVRYFFRRPGMLKDLNSTILTLVPKGLTPTTMADFRPIACCNTLYKCITKILATRLQTVMPFLVSDVQGAFVKGRDIADNIHLAQELARGYDRKGGAKRCMIKLDLRKAFDSLDWGFLLCTLRALQIPEQFVYWVERCITTSWFSVALNGSLHGFFEGRRGVRQGDPLSPYLFVLGMEVLTGILDYGAKGPLFTFHPKCRRESLSHLMFADDVLIFSGANRDSLSIIKQGLGLFQGLSGLEINQDKSEMFFGGCNEVECDELVATMGFRLGALPVRYLGVPLITGRLSRVMCDSLQDRIASRIEGWSSKCLSFAGRVQLIKSVLASIGGFWGRMFMLPRGVIGGIEKKMRMFLWSGGLECFRKAKVSWKEVCKLREEGGLGIPRLLDICVAAGFRHIWQLITHHYSVWTRWVHSYRLKGVRVWDVVVPNDCAWYWRHLMGLRSAMYPYVLETESRAIWLGSPDGVFSTASAREVVREAGSVVDWASVVWFRRHIPKHAFHVWIVVLDRAPLRDRLLRWGLNVDPLCILCRQGAEDRDHLFFACCVTRRIWRHVMRKVGGPFWISEWGDIVLWLRTRCGGNSLQSLVVKLGFGATLFHVWMERNRRTFGEAIMAEEDIVRAILFDVRFGIYNNKGYRATVRNRRIVDRMELEVNLF